MRVLARLVVEIGGVKTVVQIEDTGVLSLREHRIDAQGSERPMLASVVAGPRITLGGITSAAAKKLERIACEIEDCCQHDHLADDIRECIGQSPRSGITITVEEP